MRIIVNGKEVDVPGELDLDRLMSHLSMPRERVAVELNEHVVPKARWGEIGIKNDDRLEIIHFVGGG